MAIGGPSMPRLLAHCRGESHFVTEHLRIEPSVAVKFVSVGGKALTRRGVCYRLGRILTASAVGEGGIDRAGAERHGL